MSSSAPTTASVATLADIERVVGARCDATDPALYGGAESVVAVERLAKVLRRWLWYPPAPKPGELGPPPGSIPWRAPIGEHLTAFDLTDVPPPDEPEDPGPDDTLPFG